MCINSVRADQLDIFRFASASLPVLLRDVKFVANNNKKAIYNAIEQYENNKWSPIVGFEGGETDDLQADHDGEENA